MARRRSPARQRHNRSVRVRRQTRRRRFARMLYRLLCLLLIFGAGALALTVFFKVDTVEVEGDTRYSADELRQTLGVQKGDNLFFWGKTAGISRLFANYPYLDQVRVRRRLPDTLVLSVTECTARAALQAGDGYVLVDQNGKLLEQVASDGIGQMPVVAGISVTDTVIGRNLDSRVDANNQLFTLLGALAEAGIMKDVNFINMNSLADIRVGYQGRFDVHFGSVLDLERKLRFLKAVVDERLSPSDIGVIDLTDETRARFRPGTKESVAASAGSAAAPAQDTADTMAQDSQQNAVQPKQDTASKAPTSQQLPEASGDAA
ncbi:MAG: cell division protein FtsQ/DivIB [Intestinibacillus sp.]